jgi:hypothetical protein
MVHLKNKNYFLLTFIIAPLLFYGIPFCINFLNDGLISFHYYKTISPKQVEFKTLLFGFLILGSLIFKSIDFLKISEPLKNLGIIQELTKIVIFTLSIFSISYIKIICFPIFLYLIANYKTNLSTKLSLLLISFINLIMFGERYALILMLLFVFKNLIEKLNFFKITGFIIIGLFGLVFILEPLKRGTFESQYNYDFTALVFHLQPIYVASIESLRLPNSISELTIESLPFLKSIFQKISVVDKIGYSILPNYLYYSGNRLGSNSSMFFNLNGLIAISLLLTPIIYIVRRINSAKLNNTIMMYLFLMAPYFIRRSISSFIVDFIILIFIYLIFHLFNQINNKK